jgi:hypothetical protein
VRMGRVNMLARVLSSNGAREVLGYQVRRRRIRSLLSFLLCIITPYDMIMPLLSMETRMPVNDAGAAGDQEQPRDRDLTQTKWKTDWMLMPAPAERRTVDLS